MNHIALCFLNIFQSHSPMLMLKSKIKIKKIIINFMALKENLKKKLDDLPADLFAFLLK
jgi:hypothetical protein